MNLTELQIRKKYRYTNLSYVFDIYLECEYRANLSQEEYDGLLPGEFRFDYKSWEKRLNYSHRQMVRAIKELTKENIAIIQVERGKRGSSSKYFLARFKVENEEQKKEQNLVRNTVRNKSSNINGLVEVEEQKEEQKKEQSLVQSSQHNNLNIISNNIYSDFEKEIISIYPGKKIKAIRKKKLPKILKEYGKEQIKRCLERYAKECKDKKIDKQFILLESTWWNGRYMDYLDENYKVEEEKPKGKVITEEYLNELYS